MRGIFLLIFMGLLLLSPSFSISDKELKIFIEKYNQNINFIPDFIKTIIGNEVITVKLLLNNGTEEEFGVKTENGFIKEYQIKPYPSPTLILYVKEDAIDRIANSVNPAETLINEWGRGIKYESLSMLGKIKYFFIGIFLRIFGFFV